MSVLMVLNGYKHAGGIWGALLGLIVYGTFICYMADCDVYDARMRTERAAAAQKLIATVQEPTRVGIGANDDK